MDNGDKELLVKAARAYGIELKWDDDWPYFIKRTGNTQDWNPLANGDDTLRLLARVPNINLEDLSVDAFWLYPNDEPARLAFIRRCITASAVEAAALAEKGEGGGNDGP